MWICLVLRVLCKNRATTSLFSTNKNYIDMVISHSCSLYVDFILFYSDFLLHSGHEKVVDFLLNNKANNNTGSNYNDDRPLHYAARFGKLFLKSVVNLSNLLFSNELHNPISRFV